MAGVLTLRVLPLRPPRRDAGAARHRVAPA
jgi:hypothetical protein